MFVSSVWPIFPAHGTQGLVKTACNTFLGKVIEFEVNEDTQLFPNEDTKLFPLSKLFLSVKNSTKYRDNLAELCGIASGSASKVERTQSGTIIGVCSYAHISHLRYS